MTSVRSLTSAKVQLYLSKLKSETMGASKAHMHGQQHFDSITSLEAVWLIEANKITQLSGAPNVAPPNLNKLPNFTLINDENNRLFLKIELGNKTYIYVFAQDGLNELFLQRDGLGQTGEVYIVGKDSKIKSASRHIEQWSSIRLTNNSVLNALNGNSGVNIVTDYRNKQVVSAYSSIKFDLIEFALLAEIDLEDVSRPLDRILYQLAALLFSMIFLNLIFALFLSRDTNIRVEKLTEKVSALYSDKEKLANQSAIQIIKAQEEVREKISFTLHDSIGQYLTVLKFGLSEIKERMGDSESESIDVLSDTCDDIIYEIRSISHDLMPTLIKDFGCCLAIKDYFRKQQQIIPLKMNFTYPPELENYKFRKEFEISLYRMVQEFFQNTLKHSEATAIELTLQISDNEFIMTYYDDGKGMGWHSKLPSSLNYRANLFRGKMERLKLEKGLGFQVTFNLKEVKHEAS